MLRQMRLHMLQMCSKWRMIGPLSPTLNRVNLLHAPGR